MTRKQALLALVSMVAVPTLGSQKPKKPEEAMNIYRISGPADNCYSLALSLDTPSPEVCKHSVFMRVTRGDESVEYSYDEVWEALKK